MSEPSSSFQGLRKVFWPVHRHEIGRLVPLTLLAFLICFNYSLLRNLKDSIVITAADADIIPFLKFWGILPSAIFFAWLFTRLSNAFSREKVFYILVSGFLSYYALFALVIYPARESLHLHQFADFLATVLPVGLKGFVAMVRNWTFTSFYIIAEMWGTTILFVLFWGFVNEITTISGARRFYGILGTATNVAAIAAAQYALSTQFTTYDPNFFFGQEAWEQSMFVQLAAIVISGIAILFCYYWLTHRVLPNEKQLEPEVSLAEAPLVAQKKKKKPRLSFRESFSLLKKSPYLLRISVIVLSYNLMINLVEVIWKHEAKQLYPTATELNVLLSQVTYATGVGSVILALLITWFMYRWGWTFTAMITPVILLVSGVLFFTFLFIPEQWVSVIGAITGHTPLALVVFFGSMQNALSKSAKYSVFDATKEMAFIPLNADTKLKGKAAIDGIGSRLGKSGSSLIQQGLFMLFGASFTAIAPYAAIILLIVVICWFYAIQSLGRRFHQITSDDVVIQKSIPTVIDEEVAVAQN